MDSENHNSFFFGHFSSFLGQQDGHFGPTTCMKQALGAPVQAPRPAAPSDSTLPQFINQYSSNSNRPVVISRAGRNRDSYLWAVRSSGSWTSAPFLEVFRTTPVKDIGPRSESDRQPLLRSKIRGPMSLLAEFWRLSKRGPKFIF